MFFFLPPIDPISDRNATKHSNFVSIKCNEKKNCERQIIIKQSYSQYEYMVKTFRCYFCIDTHTKTVFSHSWCCLNQFNVLFMICFTEYCINEIINSTFFILAKSMQPKLNKYVVHKVVNKNKMAFIIKQYSENIYLNRLQSIIILALNKFGCFE